MAWQCSRRAILALHRRTRSRDRRSHEWAYQSESADHRLHERHWVSVHWCRQTGQTPPVSKVFHSFPHSQNHLSSLRGDHPHSGQRMRGGSDSPGFFSSSSSRSNTSDFVVSVTTEPLLTRLIGLLRVAFA